MSLQVASITPDGVFTELAIEPSLATLQTAVGGYIEVVDARSSAGTPLSFVFNEVGVALQLEPNLAADALLRQFLSAEDRVLFGPLRGTVIVTGGADNNGDFTDLPPAERATIGGFVAAWQR